MTLDTSAIQWSAPERERATRPLLVLLHGYGSHEGDLFGLSPRLPLKPVIASLRAPLTESGGYAWFSRVDSPTGDPDPERVDPPAAAIIDWLDTLEYTSVGLLGFSQGAAIALQLLRHAPTRFAATVALSGFVTRGPNEADAELAKVKPPVFWGRGTADPLFSPATIERLHEWLPVHTTPTIRTYEGLGHGVSEAELSDVNSFLRENLA
jgi:phospholipase/carboxylesterase